MNPLTGTVALLRLDLRRDRVIMPVWILGFFASVMSLASAAMSAYATVAERQHYFDINTSSVTFVVRNGQLTGSSLGEIISWSTGFVVIEIALVSLLTVIRHTRTEEEAGRRELTESTAVGRHAGLAAAVLATSGANVLLGLLAALALTARGLPASGSFALGGTFVVAGCVFAAIGAVAAQLTWSAGGARGLAIGVLVLAFLLRAVADVSDQSGGSAGWLGWLSPFGWAERIRPYAGERWWLVPFALVVMAGFVVLAAVLSERRDLGAGLLAARLGRATAKPSLRSPLTLAWRLHGGLLVTWTACAALIGLVMGGVALNVTDELSSDSSVRDVFARLGGAGAVVDAYFASTMTIFAVMAAGYAIQATLKLRTEETSGRAEPVLATAVGRVGWAASHLALALLGSVVVLATAGLATGMAYGGNTGDVGHEVTRLTGAALTQLPAVWVVTALALALVGIVPRLAPAAWGVFAGFFLLTLLGSALQWNQRILDLSPFTHIPKLPGGTYSATPLVWLTVIAMTVTATGLVALRRRDIPVG